MAEQHSKGAAAHLNIDNVTELSWIRVQGSSATSDMALPYSGWFILITIPIDSNFSLQFAIGQTGGSLRMRIKWDAAFREWITL